MHPPLRLRHIRPPAEALARHLSDASFLALIADNAMVPLGYESMLAAAFQRLRAQGSPEGWERLEALCLLCSTLEHALRRAYCALNNLSELSVSADSQVLYTTLDLFMAVRVGEGDASTANRVVEALGAPTMMALLDLMHLPRGPRIRDRVAHGELMACDVADGTPTAFVVDCVFSLYASILASAKGPTLHDPLLLRNGQYYAQYASVCHPKARALASLRQLSGHWNALDASMLALYSYAATEGELEPPCWRSDPVAFANGTFTMTDLEGLHPPVPSSCEPDQQAHIRDLFCGRVGRHAITDEQLARVDAATDCGPDWSAFAFGHSSLFQLQPVTLFGTCSPDGLAKKLASIGKACHRALAALHVQIVSVVRQPGHDSKGSYRLVDSVVLLLRVYRCIGRILVERFFVLEKMDRSRQLLVPQGEQNDKY